MIHKSENGSEYDVRRVGLGWSVSDDAGRRFRALTLRAAIRKADRVNDRSAELRAFADREVPVAEVKGAADVLYGVDDKGPLRKLMLDFANQAELHYAAVLAGQAADMLREVFGPTAHRAVFHQTETDDDRDAVLNLLVVLDAASEVVWYDQEDPDLHQSRLVMRRVEIEAYGGPVIPHLDSDTKRAIERLLENAENVHGYLSGADLDLGPYYAHGKWYSASDYSSEGEAVELVIPDEPAFREKVIGEPVPGGANMPQRRLLTLRERDVATRTLLGVLYHTQAGGPLTLAAGDQEVIEEVARVLDPIGEHTAARLDLPLVKPLTREEVAERAVDGRLTVVVAVDKSAVIGADVDGYNDLLSAAATGDEYALTNIGDRIVSECAEGLLIEVSGDVREWLADED